MTACGGGRHTVGGAVGSLPSGLTRLIKLARVRTPPAGALQTPTFIGPVGKGCACVGCVSAVSHSFALQAQHGSQGPKPTPRGVCPVRGWATRLPPHGPAHVLSHPWRAARAKAPSRARRSAAQLAWEAAAAQRCRAPTGELVGRWPLAEAGSGGACPAKARRAARELLLSSATVVQGSALQAGSGAERASEPPCDVQHSGDCCVAASKTASWVPRAGRAARPAVAAAD